MLQENPHKTTCVWRGLVPISKFYTNKVLFKENYTVKTT